VLVRSVAGRAVLVTRTVLVPAAASPTAGASATTTSATATIAASVVVAPAAATSAAVVIVARAPVVVVVPGPAVVVVVARTTVVVAAASTAAVPTVIVPAVASATTSNGLVYRELSDGATRWGMLLTTLGRAIVLARGGSARTSTTGLGTLVSTRRVALGLKTDLFDVHGTTLELGAVESSNGSLGLLCRLHGHETEATRVTCVRVIHDLRLLNLHSCENQRSLNDQENRYVRVRPWRTPPRAPGCRPCERAQRRASCSRGCSGPGHHRGCRGYISVQLM
jgi:hypothetical protein